MGQGEILPQAGILLHLLLEKKARKTPDEPGCRSTLVLWSLLIFIPPFPVKYSGVIFVMGILVRGMGSGEQARG